MTINGKRLMEKLDAERVEKRPVTLSLPADLYAEFQRKCGVYTASAVIEAMLRDFVETAPEPTGKPKKVKR